MQNPNFELKDALSVVELEERFEMTVAAVDTARCDVTLVEVNVVAA
ncbi:MAG TPA: hypothetical protein PKE06_11895 [Flavilitoribacter sp.]|nr:hypothetical protein [Lewinella sp.]HMQ61363.1 hypothetical protein [Flavilitoribacter sp.]HMQ86615.1 hypothetical protein [Flavilitoribacter sp.]